MAASRVRSWPDLPSELLGLVLSLLQSHADRIRTAAVCRPWRTAARLEGPALPPLLPLLALCDGTFLSLPDGAIHRPPAVAQDVSSRVSTGSTLFLVHRGGKRCSLMNPFSATTTPLPELNLNVGGFPGELFVQKVVASNHLIAALVKNTKFNSTKVIASTRGQQQCDITRWEQPPGGFTNDIALFKGKLYILTTETKHYQRELHVLDAGTEHTIIRRIPRVDDDDDHEEETWYNPYATDLYVQRSYLVASGDRLLVVKRMINKPPMMPIDSGIIKRTRSFRVFEAADLESTGHGRWIEVDTLMGRAIFLSEGCSESLPVVGQWGVREDCIYFITKDDKCYTNVTENPMLDSGVYSMRDKSVMPLLLDGTATPTAGDGPWSATWLFPET